MRSSGVDLGSAHCEHTRDQGVTVNSKRSTLGLWGTSVALLAALAAVSAVSAVAASAAAPVNITRPTITGTAREGQTLSATRGTWQNTPTSYRFRWQRCDADGTGCVSLVGETLRTYILDANDVGHRVRVVVTATNADGTASATSELTAVVSSSSAPKNTALPTISGTARVGEELTADNGTWSGAPDRFAYQWQRCDTNGASCADVAGATGKSYGVRAADAQHRLRVVVVATNGAGSTSATSAPSAVVAPSTPPPPAANQRPTIRLISVRIVGSRVYARFRVCDDSRKLTIVQTDSRPGRATYTRRFAVQLVPQSCATYTRNWLPAPRFRGHGRYIVTLRAQDTSGRTSLPARKVFVR
jgi:hypothetical protein